MMVVGSTSATSNREIVVTRIIEGGRQTLGRLALYVATLIPKGR